MDELRECSVQLLSHVRIFATPWTAACQASLSLTVSWGLPKVMSIELVMPSNHLILCHPLLLLPSTFPSIRAKTQMKIMGEKSHRAAMSAPVFHPDNALRAQRGTEAMDPFHWPSQFCTLGPFLLMCLDGQDAVFMFFSRSVHLARATWLMLPARNE